jgi:hypothetical protein
MVIQKIRVNSLFQFLTDSSKEAYVGYVLTLPETSKLSIHLKISVVRKILAKNIYIFL